MHILFAGGGTAGHINPALSVAKYLQENYDNVKISYIGTEKGLESRLVREAGYDFYTIEVSGFQRKINFENIKKNIVAVKNAVTSSYKVKKILKDLSPDVVVGTGGYVSGPVLRTAAKMGIKTAIHEQNAYPGVTTKMLIKLVDKVMLAMPEAATRLKYDREYIVTGNPVREKLIIADRNKCREKIGIKNETMILSFGGSLGARAINEAIFGVADYVNQNADCVLYHATGKNGHKTFMDKFSATDYSKNKNIRIVEYINNMDELLTAADIVVCRAGAITLAELQACGKASVLIPSPYVAENHQYFNALTLKNKGAAEIIEEKDLTSDSLKNVISKLLSNNEYLKTMADNAKESAITDSNKKIAEVITSLL